MSAGQPGIFINHAAQKFSEIGISAFPKYLKRPCRRNNRIIVNAEFGSQLSQMIRKSGSAGYAVNQAFCPFQNTGQNSFGICQFPQHIHVDSSVSAGNLMRYLSLGDAALNCVFNHFFMAVGALFLIEMFNNDVSVFIIKIRAHAGKVPTQFSCAQAPLLRPSLALIPFPPSIKGRTSLPEIIMGFNLINLLFLNKLYFNSAYNIKNLVCGAKSDNCYIFVTGGPITLNQIIRREGGSRRPAR